MANDRDFFEERTDPIPRQKKRSMAGFIATYLGIWAFTLLGFWFFLRGSDAMGFSLLFLWLILPVTTFVLSFLIGKHDTWGAWKWTVTLAFGVMYMLAEYATFRTANMISFGKFHLPNFEMILAGAVISAIGVGLGTVLRRKNTHHSRKHG